MPEIGVSMNKVQAITSGSIDPTLWVLRECASRRWGRDSRDGVVGHVVKPNLVSLTWDVDASRARTFAAQLGHGFLVLGQQCDLPSRISTQSSSQGLLSVFFVQNGLVYTDAPRSARIQAGQCSVRLQARDESIISTAGSDHYAFVRIAVDPDRLASDFNIGGGAAALRTAIAGICVLDMNASMRHLVQQLLDMPASRLDAMLQIEALSLQLMAAIVGKLLDEKVSAQIDPGALSPNNERQLLAARQLLALRLDNPPSLADLARRVGTNPSKLSRGFSAHFGESVGDCLLRLRMERAKHLLVHERMSAGEVSAIVGYRHHSSFSTAFGRYFGTTPKNISGAIERVPH